MLWLSRSTTRAGLSALLVASWCGVTVATSNLSAQIPGIGARPAADTANAAVVAPGSPRASVQQFLHLGDIGDWEGAAQYLVVPSAQRGRATELAQRLKLLLEQRIALDLNAISPLAVGDTADGEPGADEIGVIATTNGEVPIRLVRTVSRIPARWHFSGPTIARIDELFNELGAPWLRKIIPEALKRDGPLNVFLWQWIGLAIAIPLLLVASWALSLLLRAAFLRLAARTESDWDNRVVEGLRGPFRLWIVALGLTPIIELLEINVRIAGFLNAAARGLVLIALFWGLLRFIRIAQKRMEAAAFEHGQVQARTLIPLLGNFLRVTLAIIALLVALSQFGYPVGTLLTGLGIGGIAIALAGQKTVEHLFGSVSLAADKAFRVGDWVRASGSEGAVERIGLRSTSIRTNERTVIRIPNGRLADERIETFGERDRMLLRTDLDLTYDTTPSQIDAIRAEVEATLRAHPKIWGESVQVHLVAFTDSAIRVNVTAWFQTTNHPEFLLIRHTLYLEFMRIIERNKSGFAFPTRTLHVVGNAPLVAPLQGGSVAQPTVAHAAPTDPDGVEPVDE